MNLSKTLAVSAFYTFTFIVTAAILFGSQTCQGQEAELPSLGAGSPDSAPAVETTITFGHRQLDQMLEDRPGMKNAVPLSHPIRKALIEAFNGKLIGRRVYWLDAAGEGALSGAFHLQPIGFYPPCITVTKGPQETPIDKWASALFEMYNLEGDFNGLDDDARSGEITKDQYVDLCVDLETQALNKTRLFFTKHSLPATVLDKWYAFCLSSDKLKLYDAGNEEYFAECYDSHIAPCLDEKKNWFWTK